MKESIPNRQTEPENERTKCVFLTNSKILCTPISGTFVAQFMAYLGISCNGKIENGNKIIHATHRTHQVKQFNKKVSHFKITESIEQMNDGTWQQWQQQQQQQHGKNHFICISWKSKHVRCRSTAVQRLFLLHSFHYTDVAQPVVLKFTYFLLYFWF